VFLAMNDIEMKADESEFERLAQDVAAGKAGKKPNAEFFRNHLTGAG
jgi:prophage maintenance system killer protein